eukprot:CAMPEP_0185575162 /NCGR_PEP_ID=MMETSP0434-20130131/6434_1 /TAXON_ID=626734 ORGANISM="Favella taraikaensis, Strain Fe Narragansett Bay" /NCGR_SAMPLE_ID=MMETSP0434 /ASSEMBLY_ACC=CAM_ASM_000379 /LENGTH=35 /DNA_ID= /DNA_START= /DNA_END= /DNA_ORIENTATION=
MTSKKSQGAVIKEGEDFMLLEAAVTRLENGRKQLE